MVILSNGLTDQPDEGFLNVANNLVRRIKASHPETVVVSYERRSAVTDHYLTLNKLLLSRRLFSLVRRQRVLYIPFPAKTLATALRIFLLSLLAGRRIRALLVMKSHYGAPAQLLLRLCGAEVVALSAEAADFYRRMLPARRVTYLRAGVDTDRFSPVPEARQRELKSKYGLDPASPVVLHVGHLKEGRGIRQLLQLDARYQVLLVTSTLTAAEQDRALKEALLARPRFRLIEEYVPRVEELYQLCDVYLFPTVAQGNCIDVPLSCLEAAACGKPVVTTAYGEMGLLLEQPGFYPIPSFEPDGLNRAVETALHGIADPRPAALAYDWGRAVAHLAE